MRRQLHVNLYCACWHVYTVGPLIQIREYTLQGSHGQKKLIII